MDHDGIVGILTRENGVFAEIGVSIRSDFPSEIHVEFLHDALIALVYRIIEHIARRLVDAKLILRESVK
jgi:hypothetical protein